MARPPPVAVSSGDTDSVWHMHAVDSTYFAEEGNEGGANGNDGYEDLLSGSRSLPH